MDGLKKRLNESIQLKLSFTLSLSILVVAIVAGIFSFWTAFEEAHELQDDVLIQIAQLVDRQGLSTSSPGPGARQQGSDEELHVIVQFLRGTSQPAAMHDDGGPLPLSSSLSDGLHTLDLAGQIYRVLVRTSAAGERLAVSQEVGFRDEIAREAALHTVMPLLILVPVLLLMVADLVRKMLGPITSLSKEIDQRTQPQLHAIEESSLPIEIRPFVVAINGLLTRVSQAMDSQRRFVADAAHELRSPLAAMSLQAERLADTDMSAIGKERLIELRQGIDRGRKLMDQLLSLARVQASSERPQTNVSVQKVYRRVAEDLMPLAHAKSIDLGVEGSNDAYLQIDEVDIIAVVKNLVDNAIRYTPAGGRVDLSVTVAKGHISLQIVDNGPGISIVERKRVFDPFYRTLGNDEIGSGLGLSIAQAVAAKMGAEIRLEFSDLVREMGLTVTVSFPTNTQEGHYL